MERETRPKIRPGTIIGAVVVCSAVLGVFGGLSSRYSGFSITSPLSPWKVSDRFEVGNVALGTTVDQVREYYPSATLTIDDTGQTRASYSYQGGNYNVWFVRYLGSETAFRLQLQRSFAGFSTQDLADQLIQKFGKPASTDCLTGSDTSGKGCRIQWWVGNVSVNAMTWAIADGDGGSVTHLMMTAIDTHLAPRTAEIEMETDMAPASGPEDK